MPGTVSELVILPNMKDPVLISAFGTPGKSGSTAASVLSYLAGQWGAQPVVEFDAHQHYSYTRMRPQLVREESGSHLQWPSNTVYLANPPGLDRSVLLLVGVEPSLDWQGFIETIEGFCRRHSVSTAIMLHSAPAAVSHRRPAQVAAVYGSVELRDRFALPATIYQEGPMDFNGVLALHLQASGCSTVDLIALEPFYTPALPDAQTALGLVRAIDRYFGTTTLVESLEETARSQREAYDSLVAGSEQLSALANSLEQSGGGELGDGSASADLSVQEVMNEVKQILSGT